MYRVLGIMTVYNRLDSTKQCINSLENSSKINWHFVITDDNSTDGTSEYLASLNNVTVVKGNGSMYYSGGMRAAIKKAKEINLGGFDYVLLMNNDVVFQEASLMHMINELQNQKVIIAGNICNKRGKFTYGAKRKSSRWMPHFEPLMPKETFLQKADLANGNCLFMLKEVFLEIPNIDPVYVHSLGDYDYTLTAARQFPIYGTSYWIGVCDDDHEIEGSWKDKKITTKERYALKETPLGNPRKQWFYFLRKNYNLLSAIIFSLNDDLKVIMHQ